METNSKNELIVVDLTPKAKANWSTLGTEYQKSFWALKELIDNSISARQANFDDKLCKIRISIEELDDMNYKICINDNSGGINDPSVLLTIGTESTSKKGTYNYYGYGLKNSLAYFQPNWNLSQWKIQSRTSENIENDEILEINAPYCYNHEFNELYEHDGMNIKNISDDKFKGHFDIGTYIEFNTSKSRFNNMHPIKGGRPITTIETVATTLSDVISMFYRPLFKENLLSIDIFYCTNDGKRNFKSLKVKTLDLPIKQTLKSEQKNIKTEKGGKMTIDAKWFTIDRDCNSVYDLPQQNGLLLYVNGILVEPFKWVDNVFGGNAHHPSMNSLICYVEIKSDKENTPELSVSKTKIQESGENYQSLVSALRDMCPSGEINFLKNSANTQSEIVKRDRRFDIFLKEQVDNKFIFDLQKERSIRLIGNESLRADIFYKKNDGKTIVIEEFKKEKINTTAVGQVMIYKTLLEEEFPTSDYKLEIKLFAKEIQTSAKNLISLLNKQGYDIKFHSFNDSGLG